MRRAIIDAGWDINIDSLVSILRQCRACSSFFEDRMFLAPFLGEFLATLDTLNARYKEVNWFIYEGDKKSRVIKRKIARSRQSIEKIKEFKETIHTAIKSVEKQQQKVLSSCSALSNAGKGFDIRLNQEVNNFATVTQRTQGIEALPDEAVHLINAMKMACLATRIDKMKVAYLALQQEKGARLVMQQSLLAYLTLQRKELECLALHQQEEAHIVRLQKDEVRLSMQQQEVEQMMLLQKGAEYLKRLQKKEARLTVGMGVIKAVCIAGQQNKVICLLREEVDDLRTQCCSFVYSVSEEVKYRVSKDIDAAKKRWGTVLSMCEEKEKALSNEDEDASMAKAPEKKKLKKDKK